MQFGHVPLADAIGTILAHSHAIAGGVIKKGRVLTADDVSRLRAAGVDEVVVVRLAADDVGEDEAARLIATRLAGRNARCTPPFTGRANIYATSAGLAVFDPAAIGALNALDERITVATVSPYERVAEGQMLATVKIIPFAVPENILAGAVGATQAAALSVAGFGHKRVGLVVTRVRAMKDSVTAKRRAVTEARLAALGASTEVVEADHTVEAVASAIRRLRDGGSDVVLVFSASAIVDRADSVPAGLVAAGGRIERLGMPVDPGNLMLLGALDATPVIGIPTCAASPKLNGFDWVLERTLAGLPVTGADIAAMGVGGLLKEIPSRPQPRESGTPTADDMAKRRAPRLAAVVLAGGRASRMGENKLAADAGGIAVVRRTVSAILAANLAPVVVVTGHEPDRVRAALVGLDVEFVHNANYADGISTSLKTGIGALGANVDGAFVALGDMPEVPGALYLRMAAAFSPGDRRGIVVPVLGGKRGNPVLWARSYFADMAAAHGDTGARHLIGENADDVAEVDAGGDAVFTDIDTLDALRALRERLGQKE